jgi:hypothetical protein
MLMPFVSKGFQLMALSSLVITLNGCVNAKFGDQVSSFKKTIDTANITITSYLTEMNSFERQLYFDEISLDPKKHVALVDAEGKPTPLLGKPFKAESIKARTDAISLIGVYAARLNELAASDAPTQFASGSDALGDSLSKLHHTFDTLAKRPQANDATANLYIAPVSMIVGAIGKMYLDETRDKMLSAAITEGAPKVDEVLKLLEKDLVEVVNPLRITGLDQSLAERVRYYKQHSQEMTLMERREFLHEIKDAADNYETAAAFNPSVVIESMRRANQALVAYAQSSKKPQDLNQLWTALKEFENRVNTILPAITALRQKSK